ncbi:hypothetical protein EK21DRAFT_116683 [Setomelanomma holmii]|uniref:Uncharacterized protein n=1 Tax=Setomelanomma holmii TaxID=210430 RepID=A0A9P4H1J4_9PLEO|nr:hypothetical protein EK21DRAFT_116683 [Setomelanomma holmii]
MSWDPANPPYPFLPGDKRPLFYNPKPSVLAAGAPEYKGPWEYRDRRSNATKRQRVKISQLVIECVTGAEDEVEGPVVGPHPEDQFKNCNDETYRSYLLRTGRAVPDQPKQYPPTYAHFIEQDEQRMQNKRRRAEDNNQNVEEVPARKIRVTEDLKEHNSAANGASQMP